jgi:hypothetical protein
MNKQLLILTAMLPFTIAPTLPANAAIHEMVAAYCSGGGVGAIDASGFLEPPGVTGEGGAGSAASLRRPPTASGVVVGSPPVIGSSPAAKYPAGTPILGPTGLNATGPSLSNHPSAEHCANAPP